MARYTARYRNRVPSYERSELIMNQGILFNDQIEFDVVSCTLTFNAMVSGMIVPCIIATPFNEQSKALAHFAQHQFDYEIQAEQLIEDETYQPDGSIKLAFL